MKKLIVLLIMVLFSSVLWANSAPTYPVDIPVKMNVPWYIEISPVSPIVLAQEGGLLGRNFQGCGQLQFACNFNFSITCAISDPVFAGAWKCWFQNPGKYINWPGGTTEVCIRVNMADLLDSDLMGMAGKQIQVAMLNLTVIPR
jgi:hypothetical protein